MAYPNTLASFPTHIDGQTIFAADINNIQTEVIAIETFVGTISSTAGTLENDIRNPLSGGGGHVQTANAGGTGQTNYNKGDLLAGSSSSVLSKLGVGIDGNSLIADSSQSAGISWGLPVANIPYGQDTGTGSVLSISPIPCILSYAPGQIYVAKINTTNTVISPAISISSLVAKKIVNSDYSSVVAGQIISSSLSLFGYDGSASVMQLLNGSPYKLGFGAWASLTTGSNVQSSTDGFIVGYFIQGGSGGLVTVKSDSSATPSTIRVEVNENSAAGATAFMCPVKKNDYYKVNVDSGSGAITGFFIPIL